LDPIEPVGQAVQVGDVHHDGAFATAAAAVGDVACGGSGRTFRWRCGLGLDVSLGLLSDRSGASRLTAPGDKDRKDENGDRGLKVARRASYRDDDIEPAFGA
jgi:hypothetical protein